MTRLRCAILDDYLDLALKVADWSKISDRVEVAVFREPFASTEATSSGDLNGVSNTESSTRSVTLDQSAQESESLK